ncbi:hypothetical protein PENSPDRAFT_668563 [Peniophora sp. CONT]|nr:hypothetical protein PENSPDRAFT_668563 [Peniophora sp. CONT]
MASDGNSTPSNKRRRTEDDETETVEIKRHDRLWFGDGNVILRCAQTDYRVHQSLLAAHSEVFRDMFAVATPGDRADDDVPVVHLSDDPDGLAVLLLFLFFHEEDFNNIGWVLDLLEIASKYIVPLARDKCLDVLRRLFPDTLQKYQEQATHSERNAFLPQNAITWISTYESFYKTPIEDSITTLCRRSL